MEDEEIYYADTRVNEQVHFVDKQLPVKLQARL